MKRHPLLCVLTVAAALRLALLAVAWNQPDAPRTPDSREFLELRNALARDGSFDRNDCSLPLGGWPGRGDRQRQPEIYRTPGYPAFLLAGLPFGGQDLHAALLLQIALDVLAVYFVFLLGDRLCGRKAGLWAAAFQATSAVALAASNRILSDGLFTFMLTAAVLLFAHHLRTGKTWAAMASALALGLAAYVRPTATTYMAILGLVLLVRVLRVIPLPRGNPINPLPLGEGRVRVPLTNLLLFCIVCGATLAPWIARNAVRADYVGFSSLAEDNLYFWAAPEVLARSGQVTVEQARARMRDLDDEDAARNPARTPGQAAGFRRQTAVGILRSHPLLYATLHLQGLEGFFLPGATDVLEIAGVTTPRQGTADVLRGPGLRAAILHYFHGDLWAILLASPMLAVLLIQYAGVGLWIVRACRRRMPWELWLLLALVLATGLLSGPFGAPLYRAPVEPLLSVLAAAGWAARLRLGGSGGADRCENASGV